MPAMRYREALGLALREEMHADENVFLMGEDIGVFQGAFKVTQGLLEEFGEKRVRDTPISENTIVGAGIGAAMAGLRPVVELMTINFSLLALDQIVNCAASIRYMFGGQVKVPMVIRMPQGAGHQLGPTHSHSLEAIYLHVPGLLVAVPTTAADARGLLKAAIRDDNPVIFIEHESLYGQRGEVADNGEPMRFGEAAVRREGDDVTIVGISRMALTAEKAAEELATEHEIDAEVIDPRTLRPLDLDTILESVRKTNRAVIVEEGWPHGGVGANLAALIQEQAFDYLDAPVERVTGVPAPMPYEAARAGGLPPRRARRPGGARDVQGRLGPSHGHRRHHAPPVRLDGGGNDPQLDSGGGRRGEARRAACRDRDRQGQHDLRGRHRRHADRDRRGRGGDAANRRGDRAHRRPRREAGEEVRGWGREAGGREGGRRGRRRQGGCRVGPRPGGDRHRERGARRARARRERRRRVGERRRRAREGFACREAHGARPRRRAGAPRGLGARRADREGRRRGRRAGGRQDARAPRRGRRRGARARPRAARGARGRAGGRGAGGARRQGPGRDPGAHPPPANGVAPDGGVQGDRTRLHAPHGRGHEPVRGAPPEAQGGRGPGAVLQRHGREGVRQRAARAPARERRVPRRALRALHARQHRHRRRSAGRARGADDPRRRQEVTRRDRPSGAGADREGARGQDHPAGGLGRHLHGLQPRDVRRRLVLGGDQPAAGRAPHRRCA